MKSANIKKVIAAAGSLFVLSVAPRAHAEDLFAPQMTPATAMEKDLHTYYDGERTSAYVVMGLGAAATGTGAVLVTQRGDFSRALGWPLLTLGALETVGGVFYARRVSSEIDHYQAALDRDPSGFDQEEQDHIHGTTSRFFFYRLSEVALFAGGAGAATYGFIANNDVWKGAGIGVAAIALPFVVIDTINNASAGRYEDSLRKFEPTVGGTIGSAERPWSITLSGRF